MWTQFSASAVVFVNTNAPLVASGPSGSQQKTSQEVQVIPCFLGMRRYQPVVDSKQYKLSARH